MRSSMGVLVFLVALAIVGTWEVKPVVAQTSASACKEERRVAVNACTPVLYGRTPSNECCRLARISHIECICPAITPKMAALIDVRRAVRLIEGCGIRVPRHFKCGSITTP